MRTSPIAQERLSGLPACDRLLIALCRGEDDPDPICSLAAELVRLHGARRTSPNAQAHPERRRAAVLTQIDDVSAPLGIGALNDRMADAAEQAMHHLAVSGTRSALVHQAWTQLPELELEYQAHLDTPRHHAHQSTDTSHKG